MICVQDTFNVSLQQFRDVSVGRGAAFLQYYFKQNILKIFLIDSAPTRSITCSVIS